MTNEEIAELEKPYIEMLRMIQADYQKQAKPYVDALVHLRSLRSEPLIVMSADGAQWIFIDRDGKPR